MNDITTRREEYLNLYYDDKVLFNDNDNLLWNKIRKEYIKFIKSKNVLDKNHIRFIKWRIRASSNGNLFYRSYRIEVDRFISTTFGWTYISPLDLKESIYKKLIYCLKVLVKYQNEFKKIKDGEYM